VENISRISIRRKAKPNQVLEQMGVPYAPRPIPDFDASATMKGKRELLKKPVAKKAKVVPGWTTSSKTVSPPSITGPSRKIGIVKIARPKAKPRPQSRFEIEWALVKSVGVSKKFCLLDVAAPSRRPLTGGATVTRIERAARVPAFENLGDDSSPNVRKTPSPKRIAERRASPLPSMSDEFFLYALITVLQELPDFRLRWICRWRVWTMIWNAACSA
jgi:hypothetical protein